MKVSDVMTAQVVTAKPTTTVQQLAKTMSEIDSGAVPILEDGKVVGLVTDRDIVVRVIATGGDLSTPASDIMSGEVQTCREEDNLADATAKMASQQVRRLVVLNEDGRLCGIVSLGDIALDYGDKVVGHTLEEISAAPATH
ncbi:MAG: CBS domain-containing protein [Caulobacteraceae bacterium]